MHSARCFLSRATAGLPTRSLASSPRCMLLERTPLKLGHAHIKTLQNVPHVSRAYVGQRVLVSVRPPHAGRGIVSPISARQCSPRPELVIDPEQTALWHARMCGRVRDTNLCAPFLSMASCRSPPRSDRDEVKTWSREQSERSTLRENSGSQWDAEERVHGFFYIYTRRTSARLRCAIQLGNRL